MVEKKSTTTTSNRRRKWAPKARTGCRTCKTRHVKCDEAKPFCRRCELSGFRCDGYPNLPNNDSSSSSDPDSPPTTQTSPASDVVSSSSPLSTDDAVSNAVGFPCSFPTPYKNAEEQHALKYFVDMTATMLSRSKAGPYFWKVLIPQAAWTYPSVRHALMASAITNESLCKRERLTGRYDYSEMQALNHTNAAIKSLLNDAVPLDVVMMSSAIFGVLENLKGNWPGACVHFQTGAKLAKTAKRDVVSDPFISFYCEALASSMPSVMGGEELSIEDLKSPKFTTAKLHEAVCSLRLAQGSFIDTIPRVEQYQGPGCDRILNVVLAAKAEVDWLLPRWEALLDSLLDWTLISETGPMVDFSRVESPFSGVMEALNNFLSCGTGDFDLAKFEVAMERTMPFFAFANARSNVQMREDGAELLYRGLILRGRAVTPLLDKTFESSKILPIRTTSAPETLPAFEIDLG